MAELFSLVRGSEISFAFVCLSANHRCSMSGQKSFACSLKSMGVGALINQNDHLSFSTLQRSCLFYFIVSLWQLCIYFHSHSLFNRVYFNLTRS